MTRNQPVGVRLEEVFDKLVPDVFYVAWACVLYFHLAIGRDFGVQPTIHTGPAGVAVRGYP